MSIHGLECEVVESGTRFIENLFDGRELETEALPDDLVLVYVYSNPDDWEVQSKYFGVMGVDENNIIKFGTVSADNVADESVTRTHATEASEEETKSSAYDFGPAEAISFIDDQEEHNTFAGPDTTVVIKSSTN